MIVIDTSVIYALMDGADQRHEEAFSWYSNMEDELATTPLVLAEVDHLAGTRAGIEAQRSFRADLVSGAYLIEWWKAAARESADIANLYADSFLSLTDASLVALAARIGTDSVATFDERQFRMVRPLTGAGAFKLLPADLSNAR